MRWDKKNRGAMAAAFIAALADQEVPEGHLRKLLMKPGVMATLVRYIRSIVNYPEGVEHFYLPDLFMEPHPCQDVLERCTDPVKATNEDHELVAGVTAHLRDCSFCRVRREYFLIQKSGMRVVSDGVHRIPRELDEINPSAPATLSPGIGIAAGAESDGRRLD